MEAGKYSRTTRCFSKIKDITRFDSKFKDSPWRARTSGNLTHNTKKVGQAWPTAISLFTQKLSLALSFVRYTLKNSN